MRRICVLGDSHAGCFKLAWDEIRARRRDVALTFFAQRGVGLRDLQPEGGQLVPGTADLRSALEHTSGGLSVVDLSAYDAMLLVGLEVAAHPHWGRYSRAVVRQWLIDRTPKTMGFKLVGKIRQLSRIPVFVAHQPLAACQGQPEVDSSLEPYRSYVATLNELAFGPVDAVVLEQPAQTITNGYQSKEEFGRGSKRLDIGDAASNQTHPHDDRAHLNKAYGKVFLTTHLPTIAAASRSPNERADDIGDAAGVRQPAGALGVDA